MVKCTRQFGAVMFALAMFFTKTQPALAGALTGVSISASNNDAGATTVYTISFTTSGPTPSGDIPANGRIVLVFPLGFDVSGVSLASNISGLTGGYSSVNVASQTVTLQRDGTGISFNGAVTIRIAAVVNHTAIGNYDISVETQDGSGVNIDGPDNDSVTIDAAPLDHFEISPIISPQIAGTIFSFTISAFDEFDNPQSFTGSVTLEDNTGTLSPASVAMNGTTVTVNNASITLAQSGVQITASASGKSVTSNSFTVIPGSVNYVKVVEGPSGDNTELGARSLAADELLTVHAAGYDAFNNYISDFSVTWSSAGLTPALSGSGTSITFSPTTSPASGTITANHAAATDDVTGTISVSDGAAQRVKVLSGGSGETPEVTTSGLTTGGTLTVHASSFDADGNYINDVSVTWGVSGNIGTIPAGPSTSATFTATAPGTGQINADHASLIDDATGTITVNPGNLSYVKAVEGPNGDGSELGAASLTADEQLTAHAAGYDASDNYLGDFSVTWSSGGSLAPAVSGSGTSITFNPTTSPASGTITANHATATDDVTGTISVSDGTAQRVKILSGGSGETTEVTTSGLTTGGSLTVHASSFDTDGNYISDVSVTWSVSGGIGTIPAGATTNAVFSATTPGTGQINADHASLIDDATGTVTVNPGNLSYVKVVEGPGGDRSELGAASLTADEQLTVHAAGYDASDNYLGDFSVIWSSGGSLAPAISGSGTSITFSPTTSPASGTITANHATATDDVTGTISVSDGTAQRVKILSGSSGETAEVTTSGLTTGGTLTVHASSFDADGNYINDVSVTWSVSGGIGTMPAGPSTSATFTATTPGTGQINADHAGLDDDATGIITVNTGSLSYVKIVEGLGGNGSELTTKTLTADEILTVHAAGYDASNVYLGDFSVTWGSTGSLAPSLSGSGTNITFSPTTSPASGTITANHATATDDVTGTISVTDGAAQKIKILDTASGEDSETNTQTLTTNGTLTVHAASFDGDNNYIQDVNATWSVTGGIGSIPAGPSTSAVFSASTPGTGQINATHATLGTDVTGTITVNAGSLSYIKVIEGPNGNGTELGARSLTADEQVIVHAAGYDASNNYLGDFSVTWGSTGTLAPAVSGSGTNITFSPTTSPATGTITANHATATDDATGTITVADGSALRVRILDGASAETSETTTASLTTGGALTVHAASFDADGNYINDVSVTWSVSGGIGAIPGGPSVSATLTAQTPGTGQINADHTSLLDDATGTITVTSGSLSYVKIVEGPNGPGIELGAKSLTADGELTVHAAGYDASNNYLGDFSVTWGNTGTLAPAVSGSGASVTFSPTTSPATGTITANHATATDDATGTISVSDGAAAKIKILDTASGEDNEVTTNTLTTNGTMTVHAASFDADNNYIQDVSVTWGVTGGIGAIPAGPSTSAIFTATTPGTGQINASHATLGTDATGTITVNAGSISSITLRTAPNNGGSAFGAYSMTSDDSVTVYAAGYDVGSIYLGDVSVTWSQTGSLAPVPSGSGSSFTFRPTTAPASGTIVGTHATAGNDATGTITVSTGKPTGAFILTATPPGIPADNSTTSTISSTTGLRDADNNLVGSGKKYTINITGLSDLTITTADADAALGGHQIATNSSSILSFNVRAGTTGGSATITAISVDNGLSSSSTALAVGSINALAITAPQTISQGQQDAVVQMSVRNIGTTTITNLAGTLSFTVGGNNRNSQYNVTASPSNPTSVAGNTTATLSFLVDVNSAPGGETVTINGSVSGQVSGTPVTDPDADTPDSWIVQTAATLTVQAVTATPTTVSRGQNDVTVNVTLRNNFGSSTSAIANIDSVRLVLRSGATPVTSQYTITPIAGNPTTIAGGAEATFSFAVDVPIAATLGVITLDARAYGKDANSLTQISDANGATTTDSWTVIDAGAFNIISLTPSQINVTVGMTKTWTVKMRLQNSSSSNIGMDLSAGSGRTRIRFAVGSDTTGWLITRPTVFDGGGTTLNAGQTRDLTYSITQTTNKAGTAVISGFAGGTDLSTSLPVSDNTLDGGSGEVTVQSAASPLIGGGAITTSQLTVTAAQTQNWTVNVDVFNSGQSSIKYSRTQSTITIANGAGYTIIKPNFFADGDSVLDGSETKRLVFTVDVTGTQLGANLPIAVVFRGEEVNSLTQRISNTGNGFVTVQTAAQLRINSTTVTALNGQSVNTGQGFSVNVQVSNLGQESVDSVYVRLATNGNSTIQPPAIKTIQNLITTTPQTLQFPIISGSVNPAEKFTASITSSRAHNTQDDASIASATDDTANVKVQNPSALQVQVIPSVQNVSAGQTNPTWKIKVRVRNTGGAPLQLNLPAVSNISFNISGAPQTDYAITAPAALQILGGLTLPGGVTDTLAYTVTRTGEVGGTVTISATIGGFDKNDNSVRSASGSGPIAVASTAAVRLIAVEPIVFRTNSAGAGFVNRTQSYQIRATVENSSLEAVRDVKVSLAKPAGSQSTISPVQQTIASIAPGNSAPVTVNVTAANLEIPGGEIFEANIDEATASASGTPAIVKPPTDSTAIVIIQSRAQLSVNGSTDDPDNIVTTDQVFQIRVKVDNFGQAPYADNGQIRLAVPSGYQRANQGTEPLTRNFDEGETVTWSIRAPSSDSGPDNFILTIIDRPKDRNTDANAFVQKDIDTVRVESKFSNLSITRLFISSPSGGSDGVLSTEQRFEVTAETFKSTNLGSGSATLDIPISSGYSFVSGNGVKSPITSPMTWQVLAPNNAHAGLLDIALHLEASDQQGADYTADADMQVRTVEKANLALNAAISRPEGAIAGQLSKGQTFYIRAGLENTGTAAIVGTAKVRINFGNTGVTTQQPSTRDIAVGDSIEWELKAPDEDKSGQITVSLEPPYPDDENTNADASRAPASRTIQVSTGEPGSVVVTDFYISYPSGAQDGTLSTEQAFQVTAMVDYNSAERLTARLNYPPDFLTATPTQVPTFQGQELTWDVTAPATSTIDQQLYVSLHGYDSSDDQLAITDTSDIIIIQVVRRAELRLSAKIFSPPSAIDGSVSIGQYFTVEASLDNLGEANTTGEGSIYLSLPVGYTTLEPVIKPYVDQPVQWLVRARDSQSASLDERIVFELRVKPADENTNRTALVSRDLFELPILTEPKRLVVRALSGRSGNSVAQGERNISLMGLDFQNQSDATSSNIVVNSLSFTVRNHDGELAPPNGVLAAIRAQGYNNPARLIGEITAVPETNPLVLSFSSQPEIVNAGARDSIEIVVDLAENISNKGFYVSMEDSAAIDAIDEASAKPVEIMDSEGRTGLAFEVRSELASLIEAAFEKSFVNFPNPFGGAGREETKFVYYLDQDSDVELKIYSLLGELVWQVSYKSTDPQGRGTGTDRPEIVWDGTNSDKKKVLNGVYIAVLKTVKGTATRKVAFIK